MSLTRLTLTPAGFVEEATLSEYGDAGMACAWSPSGACLAAGSQDGHVVVWDARCFQVGHAAASVAGPLTEPACVACRMLAPLPLQRHEQALMSSTVRALLL